MILNYEDLRQYDYEQIVRYFNIPIEAQKCCCPFHQDKTPSHQIYHKHGYCFGCGKSWDVFSFVQDYLKLTTLETFRWFETHPLPKKSGITYKPTTYAGTVNKELIHYWHSYFTHYDTFKTERLLEPETVDWYEIGYRPDWNAYSIPFWRGLPGQSEIDICQFRLIDREPKYIGLKGHNRTAFMNAHLLVEPQDYVLVLFGSFDSMLAVQDGLCAVGMNGSNFGKKDKTRIKELFKHQTHIIVVPDNTPAEIKSAYTLAELLNAEVKLFPSSLPEGTDYIDYRQTHSVLEFEYTVLGKLPPIRTQVLDNLVSLIRVGDPHNFIPIHALDCQVPAFMAAHLSAETGLDLWRVKTYDQLIEGITHNLRGGW